MSKGRASLITSVVIGLLAISTAGVSTYAWFQATASATVSATGTSTQITVTKPDEYTFWAYNHNGLSTYGTVTDHATDSEDFENDFTAVTNSNAASKTAISNFNPGQSMVYCLEISSATVGQPVTLKIKTLISNTAIKQGLSYHRYAYNSSTSDWDIEMNVGWAIDIYTMASTTGGGYEDFLTKNKESASGALTDRFNYGKDALGYLNDAGTGSAPNKVITLSDENKIVLYNENAAATKVYLFYRVYFSNLASTYYKERQTDAVVYDNVEVTNADRKFTYAGDTSGTSNCYGGLKFQLTNLELSY